MADEPAAGTVPVQIIAKLLMLTDHRIQQLVREGHLPRPDKRGMYSVPGCVQGYIKYLKDEGRQTSKSASASRVQDARSKEIEMRLAERRGELVDADDAVAALDVVIGPLKSDFAAVAPRVTDDVALRRVIEDEIDAVLTQVAGRCAVASRTIRSMGTSSQAIAADEPLEMGEG